ncbi:unnamed protein product, partial [Rotaria magnacalcarata]
TDTISIDDNFFQLGGDSILGIQLISSVRREYGIPMTIRQLFDAPTIRTLAEKLVSLSLPLSSNMHSDDMRGNNSNEHDYSAHPHTALVLRTEPQGCKLLESICFNETNGGTYSRSRQRNFVQIDKQTLCFVLKILSRRDLRDMDAWPMLGSF